MPRLSKKIQAECDRRGISHNTFNSRVYRLGWSAEKALSVVPVSGGHPYRNKYGQKAIINKFLGVKQ